MHCKWTWPALRVPTAKHMRVIKLHLRLTDRQHSLGHVGRGFHKTVARVSRHRVWLEHGTCSCNEGTNVMCGLSSEQSWTHQKFRLHVLLLEKSLSFKLLSFRTARQPGLKQFKFPARFPSFSSSKTVPFVFFPLRKTLGVDRVGRDFRQHVSRKVNKGKPTREIQTWVCYGPGRRLGAVEDSACWATSCPKGGRSSSLQLRLQRTLKARKLHRHAWRFARGRRFALCWDCPGFAVALGSPSLACLASCNTAPAYRPPRRRGWPALVKGATAPRSPAGGHWRWPQCDVHKTGRARGCWGRCPAAAENPCPSACRLEREELRRQEGIQETAVWHGAHLQLSGSCHRQGDHNVAMRVNNATALPLANAFSQATRAGGAKAKKKNRLGRWHPGCWGWKWRPDGKIALIEK